MQGVGNYQGHRKGMVNPTKNHSSKSVHHVGCESGNLIVCVFSRVEGHWGPGILLPFPNMRRWQIKQILTKCARLCIFFSI